MRTNIYSIFDTVAEVFNKPFTEINDQTAMRAFRQAMMEAPHKNDYILYCLGAFTDHDGAIVGITPKKLLTGFEVKTADIIELPESLKEQNS